MQTATETKQNNPNQNFCRTARSVNDISRGRLGERVDGAVLPFGGVSHLCAQVAFLHSVVVSANCKGLCIPADGNDYKHCARLEKVRDPTLPSKCFFTAIV